VCIHSSVEIVLAQQDFSTANWSALGPSARAKEIRGFTMCICIIKVCILCIDKYEEVRNRS
jgi:hypothetical protein